MDALPPRYFGQEVVGDPFAHEFSQSMLQEPAYERGLYLGAAEDESGYIRDRNVFCDDITIEDAMNVLGRYRSGTLLNYSLNAFSPYEGYRVELQEGIQRKVNTWRPHSRAQVGEFPIPIYAVLRSTEDCQRRPGRFPRGS